jgi:hypothetical protein
MGAFIIKMSYGEKVYRDHGEDLVQTNKERGELASGAFLRVWMVNIFPIRMSSPDPISSVSQELCSSVHPNLVPRSHFSSGC